MLRFTAEAGAIRIGGETPAGIAIGDTKVYPTAVAPVDRPGTLTVTGTRISGRSPFRVAFTLVDLDGVGRVTAATLTARDNQTRDILASLTRTDASTMAFTIDLRNARWQSGTVSVTYADSTSVVSTLTGAWSIA